MNIVVDGYLNMRSTTCLATLSFLGKCLRSTRLQGSNMNMNVQYLVPSSKPHCKRQIGLFFEEFTVLPHKMRQCCGGTVRGRQSTLIIHVLHDDGAGWREYKAERAP